MSSNLSPLQLRERAEQLGERVSQGKVRLLLQENLVRQWDLMQREFKDILYYRTWTGMTFDMARYHLEKDITATKAALVKLERNHFWALREAGMDGPESSRMGSSPAHPPSDA